METNVAGNDVNPTLDGIGRGIAEISTVFPYGTMRYVVPSSHPWFAGQLRVSVIVCTRDRPACLAATLHSLYAQTTVPFELVIVDQSVSPEHAKQTQDEFAVPFAIRPRGMRFIYDHSLEGASLSHARNRGKELARGDIVLFIDEDVVLEPHFIEEIVKVYQDDDQLDGVSGTVIDPSVPPANWSWWRRRSGSTRLKGFAETKRDTQEYPSDELPCGIDSGIAL